jgi:rhodanese-related sulfurtransferase
MPTELTRDEVRAQVAAGAQLVEVLPASDFDEEHLAGAISLPLETLNRAAAERLDRNRAIIVYCYDYQ